MAMIQCDRCGSGLKDGTAKCHICGAEVTATAPAVPTGLTLAGTKPAEPHERELVPGIPGIDNQAPPPNYLSGSTVAASSGTGEMRVSLTGEVFEAPPSIAPRPAPGTPGMNAMGRPMPPAPQPVRAGSSIPARRDVVEAAPRKGSPVAVIVLLLVILGAGGAGGYWWWNKQQGPARATEKVLLAFQKKNWDQFIGMIEFPSNSPLGGMGKDMIKTGLALVGPVIELKSYKIGKTTFDGEKARVEVTQTVVIKPGLAIPGLAPGEKTSTSEVPLVLVKGEWKLDATSAGAGGGFPGMGGGGGLTGAAGGS